MPIPRVSYSPFNNQMMRMRLLNDHRFMNPYDDQQSVGSGGLNAEPMDQINQQLLGPENPQYDIPSHLGMNRMPVMQDQEEDYPDPEKFQSDFVNARFKEADVAKNAYREHLSRIPDRNDPAYKPGKLRRVLAGIATMGEDDPLRGMEVGRQIRDQRFDQAFGDWQAREKPMEFAYNEEFKGNNLQRQLLSQTAREAYQRKLADVANRNATTREKAARDRYEIQKKAEDRRNRILAAKEKADNDRNWSTVKSSDGYLHLINRATFESQNTGIEVDSLTKEEAEKLRFQHQTSLEAIRQRNREKNQQKGFENSKALKETPGAPNTFGTESATTVTPVFDADGNVIGRTTYNTKKPLPNPQNPTSKDPLVEMEGPDGNSYWVPTSKVDDARGKGLKLKNGPKK